MPPSDKEMMLTGRKRATISKVCGLYKTEDDLLFEDSNDSVSDSRMPGRPDGGDSFG